MSNTPKDQRTQALQELFRQTLGTLRQSSGLAQAHPLVLLALAAGKDALPSAGKGWYPDSDVQASPHSGLPILLDFVAFKQIDIRVNPATLSERTSALRRAVGCDPIDLAVAAVRSVVQLFAGHYDICPRDLWRHRRLVDDASWGAYHTGHPTQTEWQIAASITGFFEKSIVAYHLTRAEGAGFASGLALERTINQHPPHLLWALFQRSQSLLFPAEWEEANALRIAPLEPDPAADALLPNVLAILFRTRLSIFGGRLRLRGKVRCPAPWEWSDAVEALAALLAPYLHQRAGSPPPAPWGSTANPSASSGRPPGPSIMDPGDGANPFHDPGRSARPGPLMPRDGQRPSAGRGLGPGISCTAEQIDEHYSRLAGSLPIKDACRDGEQEQPEMLPIGFLDSAPASLRDLASSPMDWFRTRRSEPTDANPTGLELRRLTEPLEIPARAFEPAANHVPHLLLLVDSSSSMNFNPHATGPARGKYDLLLLACWGLFRFLKERRLEDRVWVNAINFSGATRSSGWRRGSDLAPVKRILAAYEGGGTILGTEILRTARESSPGRFVTIAVTDGSLGNTAAALEELHKTMAHGNDLVLLHIGTPNPFTRGVGRMGGAVHILKNAQELVGLCLDLAKSNYGELNS